MAFGLVCESRFVEGSVQPVPTSIARENPSRAICAVGSGGEANEDEAGGGVTKSRDGPSGVGLGLISSALFFRDFPGVSDKTRTTRTVMNRLGQAFKPGFLHKSRGKRSEFLIQVRGLARTWLMAKNPDLFKAAGPTRVRREWIESCEFHPLTNREVLGQVHADIARDLKENLQPVLLLDLDSTLYRVEPRSYQILREWLGHAESKDFPAIREKVAALKPEQVGYSLLDTFGKLGLSVLDAGVEEAIRSARKFWNERFFTNEYLSYDHAYPGAAEFVQKAYAMGAEVVYLTGRDEPGMGIGTRGRLLEDRFPLDVPRTHLLLKKSFELDDLEHKSKASDYVKRLGNLVASFENEPPNLIALSDIFPAAMHVFVDTVYSERPALPRSGLYRITGFE